MDSQEAERLKYLKLLNIQTWLQRDQVNLNETPVHLAQNSISSEATRAEIIDAMNWDELQSAVAKCQACELHKTRTNLVFGVGSLQAKLLIIGEAPGANEDKRGEPFVGRAGQLLNSMLNAIGLRREEIYIANILKSRPPNNRDPKLEEVKACTPYLLRQIALLKPKLILAVGRIAAHYLLNTTEAMGNLRGREFTYSALQVPLLITYHPAYLLRSPREKPKAWQDLQLVRQLLAGISRE